MSTIKSSYHDDVLSGFQKIPEKDFSRQIYFIEKNKAVVQDMDHSPRIDLLEKYNKALFEIGHYKKCVSNIDELLIDVVDSNYYNAQEDTFCKLLLRKACSQFNLGDLKQAKYVVSELLKINPESESAESVLRTVLLRQMKQKLTGLKSLAVMLMIFGLCITCFDLLVVQNFYPDQSVSLDILRNLLIFVPGLSIILLELNCIRMSRLETKAFIKSSRDKKSLKTEF